MKIQPLLFTCLLLWAALAQGQTITVQKDHIRLQASVNIEALET